MAGVSFKEFGLQDANTLEATQSMLESRVVDRFPLGDQEVLCRHLHKEAAKWVDDYQRNARGGMTAVTRLLPAGVRRPRAVRRRSGACRPSRSASPSVSPARCDEMQAFYDADHAPRRGRHRPTSTSTRSIDCPTRH